MNRNVIFFVVQLLKKDYETNQRARTLLKKERIHIPSNTSVIFFDKIN